MRGVNDNHLGTRGDGGTARIYPAMTSLAAGKIWEDGRLTVILQNR
jgi:hypothetical protein